MKSHRLRSSSDHRRPSASRASSGSTSAPTEDRRADQLCDHARDQHGALVPYRGSRPRPAGRLTTAWARSSPTTARCCTWWSCTASSRFDGGRLRLQRGQQQLRRPDAPHALGAARGAVGARPARRCRSCAGCTRRSRRPCSAGSSALLLVGTGETKRRRNRRGNRGNGSARQGASPVTSSDRGAPLGVSVRSLLIGVATLAVACAVVAVFAKTRPAAKSVTHQVHYTQKGHITYHATAPAGPVYPNGTTRHRRPHLPPARPPRRRQGRLPLRGRRAGAAARAPSRCSSS